MKNSKRSHTAKARSEIGWRETVGLPELQIQRIGAKIDTGARTSALHAIDLEPFRKNGEQWLSFNVQLGAASKSVHCSALVIDQRAIKNTGGIPELRYVIRTALIIGQRNWHIELSLSDRSQMEFELILGRSAIQGRNLTIDPGRSYLAGEPEYLSKLPPPKAELSQTIVRESRTGNGEEE